MDIRTWARSIAFLAAAAASSGCPAKDLDEHCEDDDECREGLTCVGEDHVVCGGWFSDGGCVTEGRCGPPRPMGSMCWEDSECRDGLSCQVEFQDCVCNDDSDCEGKLVCRPQTVAGSNQGHMACQCTSNDQCPAGQYCESEQPGYPGCVDEWLWCLNDPQRCRCLTDDDCEGDLVCRPWGTEGVVSNCTCETDNQCPQGRFCDHQHPEIPARCALR